MSAGPAIHAILLAAGRGTRLGGARPKQFEAVAGRPLFAHALDRLAALEGLAEVVLVTPRDGAPGEVEAELSALRRTRPELWVGSVAGGERRQDSVAAGLAALEARGGVVLVHDAARPFPPVEGMRALAARAEGVGGALLAVAVVDTVKQEGPAGRVARTLDRRGLWLAQTPQGFRAEHAGAMRELLAGAEEFTDETAALERLGVSVALVPGDAENFKVTHAADLARAARRVALDERDGLT
jgi:2-C-methyl-D-erythritol 4-phosphate cytidylyltransferase / 2-C-methyl-D-erythritol 2,4-cyclodiphosphate synthase